MQSLQFDYNMEDGRPIVTTASDYLTCSTTPDIFATPDNMSASENGQDKIHSVISPLAAPFQSRFENLEPRTADTAPSTWEIDEILNNLHKNNSNWQFDNLEHDLHNFLLGSTASSIPAANSNIWSENAASGNRNGGTFNFLVKSLTSANNYLSMLTREQLTLLRSIPPSLLYEFLQEVARVFRDKRLRRSLPNECAFCKNNGDSEEDYSSHVLKDWRGRVLCPVLRAFHCPRCGATGERAHTIKYCPKIADEGIERSGVSARRRRQPGSLMLGARTWPAPATPAPSPSVSSNMNSPWSNFGIN